MNKDSRTESFGRQMAHAMGELRSIMSRGQSPSANGRLTARTIEVAEPSAYNARRIKQTRAMLNVSQTVFARIVGVSDVLEVVGARSSTARADRQAAAGPDSSVSRTIQSARASVIAKGIDCRKSASGPH